MKFLFLFLLFFSLNSFSVEVVPININIVQEIKLPEISDEEWLERLEKDLSVQDKKIIKEYQKDKYSRNEKITSLIKESSSFFSQKVEERFLYPDIDSEINKINLIKFELKNQTLDGNPYYFQLKRVGNKIIGDFSIELIDKDLLIKLNNDKFYFYNFSKDFISYYFCHSEPFYLWMSLDHNIEITYNIKKKKKKIISYDLLPNISQCLNFKEY